MKAELSELTKRVILKYLTEEQIFEKYLGFLPEFYKSYANPKREDKGAGCSFYVRDSDNKLIFHDFAWGVHWDCFDVVQIEYNCNFPMALEAIARDFGLLDSKIQLTKQLPQPLQRVKFKNKLRIKRKKYTQHELNFWSIGGLIVTEQDLEESKIYSISHFWEQTIDGMHESAGLNMAFAYQFPKTLNPLVYGYSYQLYFPLKIKGKGRRRFINPARVKYGDIEFLNKEESYIVITKSRKDAFYLRLLGINTFFIINEAINLDEEMIELIGEYEQVFTLFDNDRPGLHASWKYRRNYKTIPLYYRIDEGKDTSEVLKSLGKEYMFDLIEYYKNWFNI